MKTFLKKNWRWLCALYVFIYLPWFFYLERTITMSHPDMHIMNGAIDDLIPFCEYFIIPYIMWFFYVILSCVFMLFKAGDKEFLRFALSLIIGMSIAMFICTIYPNGLTLRPGYIPDNLCGKIIKGLYGIDTSTNVFPSVHVYNSLAVHIALNKCEALKKHNVIRACSLVLCILICMSTVLLKQHAVSDVFGAIILMAVLYVALYVIDYSKLFKRASHKELEENSVM